MARIRIFIVLALALTAGGVLAFATYNYVQSQGNRPAAQGMATRRVVVAAADLAVGAELGASRCGRSTGRRAPCRRARWRIRKKSWAAA